MKDLKNKLETIYSKYNQRKYVNPDPLFFLYDYPDKKTREIVGLIASCLAYGKVAMIMKTIDSVLKKLLPDPFDYLMTKNKNDFYGDFKGFKYRFSDDSNLISLFGGIQNVLKEFSSLENCFYQGLSVKDENIICGLNFFYEQLNKHNQIGHLMADPKKKSACKRSMLFLRWMIRKDKVDPGGWGKPSPCQLVVPLDIHMYKIGVMLNFTKRKNADMKTALEITQGFKRILKHDPVKYDFCLTRFGIREKMQLDDLKAFLQKN